MARMEKPKIYCSVYRKAIISLKRVVTQEYYEAWMITITICKKLYKYKLVHFKIMYNVHKVGHFHPISRKSN